MTNPPTGNEAGDVETQVDELLEHPSTARRSCHLILPAYEEEDALPSLLERLATLNDDHPFLGLQVWVVDDGSTDRTAELAQEPHGNLQVHLLRHSKNRGLGQAMQTGLTRVITESAEQDTIVVMDADDTHDVELIPKMLNQVDGGSDIVIASRFVAGGSDTTAPAFRRFLSRGASVVFRTVLPPMNIRDFTSGYRMYRGSLLKRAHAHWGRRLIEEEGFACMVELLLKLRHWKPELAEVPMRLRYDRKVGASKLRLGRTLAQYLKLALRDALTPAPRRAQSLSGDETKAQPRQQHVLVLGGGVAGLAAAHELAKSGQKVTLLESSPRLGGLGGTFEWEGRQIDKFYHCQMPTDESLLSLIDDLGLTQQLYWKKTRMGFAVDGQRYAFNSALDLLRFLPLTFVERIRFGAMSLLLRQLGRGRDLDNTSVAEWLTSVYGNRIWNRLLKPLFVSKFGPAAGDMPALYIWQRLGREKNVSKRGYLKGGLAGLTQAIRERLEELGASVRTNTTVETVSETATKVSVRLTNGELLTADWCVSTLPLPVLSSVISGTPLEPKIRLPNVSYQGVVNGVFFLKKPLDGFYWTPVVDSGTEFDGVVEMTELVNLDQYAGHHAVYVMKYCEASHPLFSEDREDIASRWQDQLLALYADRGLGPSDVAAVKIFKAPYVEPAYPLGYSNSKPLINENGSRLFLATSSQVYPRVTAWNSSVWLAQRVVQQLLVRCGARKSKAKVDQVAA